MSVKTKLLAVISFVCLVCGLVSAQSYQIRTDNVINLRASFSLDADIVEIVGAGTVLDVAGKFNRWYRISRNGAEVWMADWVDHSRLASGAPAATDYAAPQPITGAETEIDNCCFVDRQCRTDEEWVNGYNAFQNQQCGMPAQEPMQTVTAPVSQPTVIDNLCYTVRTCTTPEEWVAGYHAFQNQQGSGQQSVVSSVPSGETAVVVRVIDGDTIDVRLNGQTIRVRYIGIDTPERGEACYVEATNYNRGLVQDKTLTLVRDTRDIGPYGRLLRYVYADGVFVNLALVQGGYAEASYYAPNGRHRNEFAAAQQTAPQRGCVGTPVQQQTQTQTQTQSQVTWVRNCTHARELGIAPVHRGHPAYRRALDRDNNGIGCE